MFVKDNEALARFTVSVRVLAVSHARGEAVTHAGLPLFSERHPAALAAARPGSPGHSARITEL